MFIPRTDRFTKDKTDMLNAYREINKEVAEQYNCPYIDMRQAFLDAIPSYRLNYKVLRCGLFMATNFIFYFLSCNRSFYDNDSNATFPLTCFPTVRT
jgi:hypothetical protein